MTRPIPPIIPTWLTTSRPITVRLTRPLLSATGIALVGLVPLIIGMMGLHLARRYRDDQIEVIVSEESLHSTSPTKSQTKPAKTRKKDK